MATAAQALKKPARPAATERMFVYEGRDKAGKEFPQVTARLQRGIFWFDLNGDGKPGGDETRAIGPEVGMVAE